MENKKIDAGILLPENLIEKSTRLAQGQNITLSEMVANLLERGMAQQPSAVVRLTEKEVSRIDRVSGGVQPEAWALNVILDVLELEEGEAEEKAAKN